MARVTHYVQCTVQHNKMCTGIREVISSSSFSKVLSWWNLQALNTLHDSQDFPNSDCLLPKVAERKDTSTARVEDLSPINFSTLVFSGNIPGLYFAFCVVIDGVEYKTGMGITKKEARLKAAELAVQDLLPTLENLKSVLPEASGSVLMPIKV